MLDVYIRSNCTDLTLARRFDTDRLESERYIFWQSAANRQPCLFRYLTKGWYFEAAPIVLRSRIYSSSFCAQSRWRFDGGGAARKRDVDNSAQIIFERVV